MMLTISYDTMNYPARYTGFQQSEFRKYRLGSAVNSESCLYKYAPNYNESMTISSKLSLTQVANYVNIYRGFVKLHQYFHFKSSCLV